MCELFLKHSIPQSYRGYNPKSMKKDAQRNFLWASFKSIYLFLLQRWQATK